MLEPARAQRFLVELANLQPIPDRSPRVCSRYPEMFRDDADPAATAEVLWLLLQKAWDAPDQRKRDWYIHSMENFFHRLRPTRDLEESLGHAMVSQVLPEIQQPGSLLFSMGEPPATPTALEAALFYFKQNVRHLRHCPTTHCPAPLFFAERKGQRYCSPECAEPARLASQRRWWRENRGKSSK